MSFYFLNQHNQQCVQDARQTGFDLFSNHCLQAFGCYRLRQRNSLNVMLNETVALKVVNIEAFRASCDEFDKTSGEQ